MGNDGWIDISLTLKPGMVQWPGDPEVEIFRTSDIDLGDIDNVSRISMCTHSGTHIDAPLHYFSGMDSIDQMPLSAAIGPARVLSIQARQSITVEELKQHSIKPDERILLKTVNSGYWETGVFRKDYVSISEDAAEYLAHSGVSVIGIDYLSVGGFNESGISTHRALLSAGIWIIEGLDLSGVEPGNYDLICLPLKILNSDGAPARVVIYRR